MSASGIEVDIDADNKPANFPSPEEVVVQWEARFALARAAAGDPWAHIRGVSLVGASGEPYACSMAQVRPDCRYVGSTHAALCRALHRG